MRISQFLYHSFAPELFDKRGVAYDLGANHGGFTEYLAGQFQTVVCVEPNPRFKLEELADNLQVMRCAVGWPSAQAWLRLDDVHVYSSLTEAAGKDVPEADKTVQVDVVTLAELFSRAGSEVVEFVKMDIEGSELDVLLNEEADVLRRIKQITVEFHDFIDAASLPRVLAALERMRGLGFEVFRFSITNHGDVLFLNSRHVRIGKLERLWIMLCYGWLRGLRRKLFRLLWPKSDPPGAYTFLK